MDKLQELLARLNDEKNPLNDEEMVELRGLLAERAEELKGEDTDEALAELREIATNVKAIDTEVTARAEAAEKRAQERDELLSEIAPVAEETPAEGSEGEGEEGTEGGSETPAEGTPAEGTEGTPAEGEEGTEGTPAEGEQPQSQAASAGLPRPGQIRAPQRQRARESEAHNGMPAIVAAGEVQGFSAGQRIESPEAAGEAFAKKAMSLMGVKGGKYPVMSVVADYPEERVLTADAGRNLQLIQNVISPQAIVAAGGLCAPVEASYDLFNPSVTDRPVRDALARFAADRGGIRFIEPPRLTDLNAGITIWTAANDENPAAPATKPCVTIACGDEITVTVDAIPLCIQVGNFSRRTFPEQFATWYQLGLAAHARVAEGNLLDRIGDLSTAVTEAQVLGAARDLLEQYGRLAAQYRSRHRTAANARLTVLLPSWVREAIRADLALQMPGDNRMEAADAEIERFFTARNLDVSWYLDSEPGAGQVAGAQAAGAGNAWFATAVGYVFAPGTFMFLDGGTLDLGVDIRDSALNSTNDVKAFMETFENVAFTGVEALKVTSTICVSGEASALSNAASCAA